MNFRIELTHSKRPMYGIEVDWNRVRHGYLGNNSDQVDRVLHELQTKGESLYIKRIKSC